MLGLPLLAIDRNEDVFERQKNAWAEYGINNAKATSMNEAIVVADKRDFIFIAINADSINYMTQLRILRSVTDAPIFIFTATFTLTEQVEALHNGADTYSPWQADDKDNAILALALLDRYSARAKQQKKAIKLYTHDKLLITPDFRQSFIGDVELKLTRTEFDILNYLIINRGRVLKHTQILRRIWGDEYDQISQDVLWKHINRLRKKMNIVSPNCDYIKSIHGIGYKLQTNMDIIG